MNIYTGKRDDKGNSLVLVNDAAELDARLDLRNHSPSGFTWGYGGSGPAQLALAILSYEYGSEFAMKDSNYQRFKADVIACLDGDEGFCFGSKFIGAWRESLGLDVAFQWPGTNFVYEGKDVSS